VDKSSHPVWSIIEGKKSIIQLLCIVKPHSCRPYALFCFATIIFKTLPDTTAAISGQIEPSSLVNHRGKEINNTAVVHCEITQLPSICPFLFFNHYLQNTA
jgi:hypothetical protein